MKGRDVRRLAILMVALCGLVSASAPAAPCMMTTPTFERMEEATVTVDAIGRAGTELRVKVADEISELAAGFQHICPEAIGDTAVLFLIGAQTRTPFHMNNVHAPLDVAFIDAHGVVVDVQTMKPHGESVLVVRRPIYRSAKPFVSALETAAGKLAALGIHVGTHVALKNAE